MVWDNFESVAEILDLAGATPPLDETGRTQLREFLDWVRDHSASTVIITSRAQEAWLGRVRRISVGGLNRVEAAQYVGYLLEPFPAAQLRREQRSFGELLEWLDGHPLAMRLTLPRLDTTEPASLLAHLQGTTPLAAEEAEPGRLSSLGACITYSFAHLPERAGRLLPAVSLFYGIADEDVLMLFSVIETVPARFAGTSRQEWAAVLQDAARVGLVTSFGAGMYQIHPALPGYLVAGWRADDPGGYEQERAACEQVLRAACAAFGRWLTEQIESGDAALAHTVIELQRRTLGAMLGHALDHQAWDDAASIVRALDAYWDTRGLGQEAAAWADRIVAATADHGKAPSGPARSLWLHTRIKQAVRQQQAGQLDQAAQTYRQALAYLRNQPEIEWTRRNISVICHQLGITAHMRGRLDEAEDWCRKSLTIKEEFRDHRGMLASYHLLGMTAHGRGRLDEADGWYRKALAIEEELGDRPGMAATSHELGLTARMRGRLDEAEDWYRKSLAIEEELGDRPHMAATHDQLGLTAQARGQLDEADGWYRESLIIDEELGDRPGVASDYHHLGMTARMRGRLEEAEDWYGRALAIREELGDRPGMADTYHQLGLTAQARGRLDEADGWYRRSLAIDEELGDHRGMALSYAQLGLLAEDRAQALQALAWNIRCVTLFSQFPSPLTRTGPSALARLARQLGMPAVEYTWQQVTGQPLPQQVRDYITSQHNDESSEH